MKFPLVFLFFFLLVLAPIISAQPPFEVRPVLLDGYFIEIPEQGILKANQNYTFFFHIFNISNGLPLMNDTTGCEFNMHDSTSKLIHTNTDLPFDATTTAFFVEIAAGNFTLGDITYVTHCNSTGFGGVVSVKILITQDGKVSVVFPQQFSVILFGLILIMFGILNPRYNLIKYMGALILMVMGVLTLFPGYNNISHTTLFGLVLGSSLIGIGFWALIEDSFSRTDQEERFHQDQGEEEFEEGELK